MKKQFCTYEISKELKELNFDEECLAYYCKEAIYEDKDGNKTNFVLLSAKKRGELVGHGSVRNYLFQWLLNNDKTHGELHTLSQSIAAPLWQQAWSFLLKKLDFYYPYLRIEIFSDYSGKLYHPKDVGIDGLEIDFDNKEQLILKLIELIKNKQICKKELNITK